MDEIKKQDHFAIFGAQVVAYGAYIAINHLYGRKPDCFIVSSPAGNPVEIEGIPVKTLDAVPKETLIVAGVTELVQKEILPLLEEKGYHNVLALTGQKEHELMARYFTDIGKFPVFPEELPVFEPDSIKVREQMPADLALYEVRNYRDTPLAAPPELKAFEIPIWAGAALSKDRAAGLTDDAGDNISHKNLQYCEMSAAYWVWKNTHHDWKGIEHYRRHLLIEPELLKGDIDAVLPLPYICYPDTVSQFKRFVSEDVFQALLGALKALHPDRYEDYLKILYGKYQYTYNLVCAKAEVFNEYCQWFFRITEYMETLSEEVPEIGTTRALSYAAEVLTNLYFMDNQNRLSIRHAEKAIYI